MCLLFAHMCAHVCNVTVDWHLEYEIRATDSWILCSLTEYIYGGLASVSCCYCEVAFGV